MILLHKDTKCLIINQLSSYEERTIFRKFVESSINALSINLRTTRKVKDESSMTSQLNERFIQSFFFLTFSFHFENSLK